VFADVAPLSLISGMCSGVEGKGDAYGADEVEDYVDFNDGHCVILLERMLLPETEYDGDGGVYIPVIIQPLLPGRRLLN
jgi:hypothetical protein